MISLERSVLIARVFEWDRVALQLGRGPEVRRGLWRILDALYADCAYFRTPGFLGEVERVLDSMRSNADTEAIRRELGLRAAMSEEEKEAPVWAGRT